MTIWNKLKQLLSNSSGVQSDWVDVFTSMQEPLVHIYKIKLENLGIPVRLYDQRDSSYNTFGYLHLLVPRDKAEVAKQILEEDHE